MNGRYVQFLGVFLAGVGAYSCVLALHFGLFVSPKSRPSMQRITEETFRILVNAGSVRKVTIQPAPWNGRERWAVVLKLGMEEATIKSARTEVRTWASLDSLARWLKAQGCGVAELRVV